MTRRGRRAIETTATSTHSTTRPAALRAATRASVRTAGGPRASALVFGLFLLCACGEPELRDFGVPDVTGWAPDGIRAASSASPDALFGDRRRFRTFHGDLLNSDEVEIAFAPMFEAGWVAEPQFYVPEGPTFDRDGNLYFVPSRPREKVLLVSVGLDGKRRFAVPGSRPGMGGAPLVLDDPARPGEERVYAGSYDSIFAVDTSGKTLWDRPTGLRADGVSGLRLHNWGINYHAPADALVAVMGDGHVVAHRRRDGERLAEPYRLPGSPGADRQPLRSMFVRGLSSLSRFLGVDPTRDLVDPTEGEPSEIIDAIMGAGSVVTNYFAIDPGSGRIWIAGTAPDDEDGTPDGRSENGALYALTLVVEGGRGKLAEHCRTVYSGGSSSTPALRADGGRVYLADDVGHLIAVDGSCGEVWRIDVGEKLLASIAVAADNGELYGITATTVVKVIDRGGHATLEWRAAMQMFEGAQGGNLSTAGIGANGVMVHVGAGVIADGTLYPRKVGLALLDRETGRARYAAEGVQESIAAMSTNVDGAVYLAHSPIRVLFSPGRVGRRGGTLIGGIGQYRPVRLELLARDAACAAEARAANAARHPGMPPPAAAAEARQITALIAQAADAVRQASGSGQPIGSETAGALHTAFDEALGSVGGRRFERARELLGRSCGMLSAHDSSPGSAAGKAEGGNASS